MTRARFGFAAHPQALADLREVPTNIRDLALLELQHLVHGNERGAPLHQELAGCHKVYVDPQTKWRMVIQYRDAPTASRHQREIYLLSVGARQDHAAYNAAARRLQHEQHPEPLAHARRAHAARARSSHAPHRATPATPPPAHETTTPHRRHQPTR